jgi:hypothetical protein
MGVWNLDAQFLSKAPTTVFTDTFETFTGWVIVGTGVVSQSSAQAYEGSFSALKSTSGDPNGAYKLLTETVNRHYLMDVWLYSVEPRAGGAADRISVVDSSGDGYGFFTTGTTLRVERRDSYSGVEITSTTFTRPSNAWYRLSLQAFPDNTFTLLARDISGSVLGSLTTSADATHSGPFDRVAILGGSDFHVDNLVVKKFS